ncbi:MAG: NUDIX domain-containing protein [Tannerella sp.]|jgi:isopentenyldiphosphate isomerase|nr:NUDIX domain-containing protein [Tannerella sp.]
MEEWFPVVDETGRTTGKATRRACHGGTKLLHPVVHLHVFNSAGELYLQKRPAHKDIQPGKWDTAVGGHVDFGETVDDALRREALEELGLTDFRPLFVERYVFESEIEKELVNTFITVCNGLLRPHPVELDGGRFWTVSEMAMQLDKNRFTPNLENEFRRFGETGIFNRCLSSLRP